MSFLDPISGFFSRVSRSVPFSKKKDPRAGRGSYKNSPLSKSSFIYLFLVFLHPKSSIGLKPRVGFFECVFFIYQQPQT